MHAETPSASNAVRRAIIEELDHSNTDLVADVEQAVTEALLGPGGALGHVLKQATDLPKRLPGLLRVASRTTLVRALGRADVVNVLLSHAGDGVQLHDMLAEFIQAVSPTIDAGSQRLLLLAGAKSNHEQLSTTIRQHLDYDPNIVLGTDGDLTFCLEVQDISLPNVARQIIDGRVDYAQAASRLHTRVDIRWNPWQSS